MTLEELEREAREQAKKIEENQTVGVYDSDEDLEYDKGWNAGEISGFMDGYIAGAEPREKQISVLKKENAELKEKLSFSKATIRELQSCIAKFY